MSSHQESTPIQPPKDLYRFHAEDVADPPSRLRDLASKLGPGMILAASIVGSGELIATTTLGAEVGYAALWVILLSCFAKPALQAELGRYIICTGRTGLAAFDLVPGPRWRVNWIVWLWALMVFMSQFQVGAMYAGLGQVMNLTLPAVPVGAWVLVLAAFTLVLLLGGGYSRVESLAMLMVALFTLLTVFCAVLLVRRPDFAWAHVAGGFAFQLPGEGLTTAAAVFGITGVGATELFMYPYWCLEKGYARFTGPRDDSPAWRARARGWIRIMHLDITVSLAVYTASTIAFYLLGAGVLHAQGMVPSANEMIRVLSRMYTQTLGDWAIPIFYTGSIAVLYSTVFAATAAHARLYADLCAMLGAFEPGNYAARVKFRDGFVWALTLIPLALFFLFRSPVQMVKAGGVAQAVMLPVIAVAILYLRHKALPPDLRSGVIQTFALWTTAFLTIAAMGLYAVLIAR